MLESLFNKAANFTKRRLQHKCFPVKFPKLLRTLFLQNTSSGCFSYSKGYKLLREKLPLLFSDTGKIYTIKSTQVDKIYTIKSSLRRSATLFKKRLCHRCFPLNFVKFLRTSFLQNTSGRLLLNITDDLTKQDLTKSVSYQLFQYITRDHTSNLEPQGIIKQIVNCCQANLLQVKHMKLQISGVFPGSLFNFHCCPFNQSSGILKDRVLKTLIFRRRKYYL